jgi:hypothetical protein
VSGARKIIIVGGGPAGVAAAMAARQQDAAAEVVLLNDEHHEPYEKPPLSKAVLTGKLAPHDTPIAGPKGIAATGVALKGGTRVAAIDRAVRMIVTDAGERVGYDALVLATGSINRVLPMFPAGRAGIYYLRTEAEARALKDHLHRSQSLSSSAATIGLGRRIRRRSRRQDHGRRGRAAHPCASATRRPRGSSRRHHARRRHPGRHARSAARSARWAARGRDPIGDAIAPISSWSGSAPRPTIGWRRRRARHARRDHRRRSRPHIRSGDLRGWRLHAPRAARTGAGNWRHALEHGAIAGRNAAGGSVAYSVAPSFWSSK